MSPPASDTRFVVFSDNWGRHPSSCQHLVRHLLPRYPTLWVDTIGMRSVRLSWSDARHSLRKLGQIVGGRKSSEEALELPANLSKLHPLMWPGFRTRWQRRFNARRIATAVNAALAGSADRTIVVTTLPITADLVGELYAQRWVYYCVDDFSVWPGLDGPVMQDMEREQVREVDCVIAASQELANRLSGMGRPAAVLTHGIDLDHWRWRPPGNQPTQTAPAQETEPPEALRAANGLTASWSALRRPILLFWGLVDARLDTAWCRALAEIGTLVLVGPTQEPDAALATMPNVVLPGAAPYELLPGLAQAADVLVMPYADLPVTRAMQPLKFKEYLAAGHPDHGKPVVVRNLPATREWCDAADVVSEVSHLVEVVKARATHCLPESQKLARQRLENESWASKAKAFEAMVVG